MLAKPLSMVGNPDQGCVIWASGARTRQSGVKLRFLTAVAPGGYSNQQLEAQALRFNAKPL